MATASRKAPATASRGVRAVLQAWPAAAVIVGVAVAVRVLYGPWFLNYDARYALLWARDIARGMAPDYEVAFAPTPHPLEMAVSLVAIPFGDGGDAIMSWAILLAFGVLTWLTFRLGQELFGTWAGVVAALVVVTRPAMTRDALLGYQDTAFAAVIVGAVLLEARRPRRGAPVLVLLALAGLMRPEAWVLAGLYWLWMWPASSKRARLGLAALTAAAPVIWALSDWAVTGDPLHSLHGTSALAEEAGRRRHLHQVPYWTAQYFGFALREPVLIGVPVGLLFAWRHRRRRMVLPLAVVAAMIAVFAIGPAFGLPLISRYVRTPSVLLILFYGAAVAGWLLLRPGRERRAWMIAGLATGALSLLWIPWHAPMLATLEKRIDRQGRYFRDLRAAARAPAVEAAFARCGAVTASDHRPMPHLRYWLGGDPFTVTTVESDAAPLEPLLIVPRRTQHMRAFYQENFPRFRPPERYREVHRNASWRVLVDPRAC